jgi:hypothetical protein
VPNEVAARAYYRDAGGIDHGLKPSQSCERIKLTSRGPSAMAVAAFGVKQTPNARPSRQLMTHLGHSQKVYSITSSAAAKRSRGTLRPRDLAVLTLMISSKLVGIDSDRKILVGCIEP